MMNTPKTKAITDSLVASVQEKEYRRLYLNAIAQRDTLKSVIVSAIVQLESNVMASQVVQQLKKAI